MKNGLEPDRDGFEFPGLKGTWKVSDPCLFSIFLKESTDIGLPIYEHRDYDDIVDLVVDHITAEFDESSFKREVESKFLQKKLSGFKK